MLASGVVAGILAGVAFGGDWRRLASFNLRLWPLLILALALRVIGAFVPTTPLNLYLLSLAGVAAVAAWNWRIPGTLLIFTGTVLNLLVTIVNSGMPYDLAAAIRVESPIPNDGLHVVLTQSTRLEFLSDVIPVGPLHSVLSLGDFLVALGGFLIPFMWLQSPALSSSRTLRSPDFAFFWVGQAISRFGDPITLVALTYVTYRATQSSLLTALAVLIATIPNALFSFVGGAVADAFGYRRVMLVCDVVRATAIGSVPLLLSAGVSLSLVFLLVFVASLCGAAFNPARAAFIPVLLDEDQLPRANSLVYATDRAVEILGAVAGGLLVATIGTNAFYVDAVTFALSAMLLSRIAAVESSRWVTLKQLTADAREGYLFLRRSAILWANTVFSLVAQLSLPIINGLTPAFVIQRFAGNDASLGAAEFGVSEAAIAVGAVIGSAVLPRYVGALPKGRLLVLGFGLWGLTVVLIALAQSFSVALGLFAILGFANVLFFVPTVTILQEGTSPATRARVFGARIALTNLSWLPLIFISGALADVFGPALLIGVAGALTLATAVVGSRIRAVYEVA